MAKRSTEMLYFTVMQFSLGRMGGYFSYVEPVTADIQADAYAGEFLYRNHFSQRPHLVGTEGECNHLKTSAFLSWSQLLAVAALETDSLMIGPNLSQLEPCTGVSNSSSIDTWLPGSTTLVSNSYQYSMYHSSCSKNTDEASSWDETESYHIGASTYAYEARCTDRKGLRHEKEIYSNLLYTERECLVYTHVYNKVRYGTPEYKHCTADDGYIESGNYKIKNRTDFYKNPSCSAWIFGISAESLRRASQSCRKALAQDSISVGLPKFRPMPVEETLLDDIYNLLDRAEMNLAATVIGLCGSIRNAKNLSLVFQKIRNAGGIRELLQSEASHLLKDKKLKTASDLYLTKKYVFDTTNMDIDDLVTKLSSRMRRSAMPVQHFSYSSYDTKMHTNVKHCIRISYKPLEQSWAQLNGLDLPLEATWDLLPWSFVVDWFTGIGDYIESTEKLDAIQEIDINSVTESLTFNSRSVRSVAVGDAEITYTSSQKYYCREVSNHLPPIYPLSPKLSNPFRHIIDGAALIFSKSK